MHTRRYDCIIDLFQTDEHLLFEASRLARSQTHLSTKSNKPAILNALKRVVLAGPANERQRDTVSRVRSFLFSFTSTFTFYRILKRVKPDTLSSSFETIVFNFVLFICTYLKQILSKNYVELDPILSQKLWLKNGSSTFDYNDLSVFHCYLSPLSRYNSGCKRFNNIPIRHFSIQCDAVIIHNDFWQKKLLMHMNKLH